MAIIKKPLGIDVLTAANQRLKAIFKSGLKVYVSVSGGKDSIVIMSLVYDLIHDGYADPKKVEIVFIDEEVIYPEVIRIVEQWRTRFMLSGAKFTWFTTEYRNNNCFNALENNESFISWDRYESDKWHHKKPPFAVSESKYLIPRVETYQVFLERYCKDGITLVGVRCSESVDRLKFIAQINSSHHGVSLLNKAYPIYDWKDSDVWKYIKDKNLDFPDVYLRMYEAGVKKHMLRICNLFAIDTCSALVHMFEVYPDLWEAVLRREQNAYLVRLYWDSEMFRRDTKTRRLLEHTDEDSIDYKAKLIEVVNNPTKYFKNPHALGMCEQYRKLLVRDSKVISQKNCKKLYQGLLSGDTKGRTLRAVSTSINGDYLKREGAFSKLKK